MASCVYLYLNIIVLVYDLELSYLFVAVCNTVPPLNLQWISITSKEMLNCGKLLVIFNYINHFLLILYSIVCKRKWVGRSTAMRSHQYYELYEYICMIKSHQQPILKLEADDIYKRRCTSYRAPFDNDVIVYFFRSPSHFYIFSFYCVMIADISRNYNFAWATTKNFDWLRIFTSCNIINQFENPLI